MIKKKDIDQIGILQKLESENIPVKGGHGGDGIDIKIVNVPENLKQLKEIYSLKLHFKKDVVIPEWLKNIRIGMLDVEGEITESETNKIIDWFPNTDIKINGKEYNKGKNGWVLVSGNKIPDEVLELKKIWILEIWNMEDKENKLIIPDALKNIKIDNLTLVNNTSPDNIELLKKLLPQTNIYIQRKKINSVR
jgi:hypothetical protein